MCRGGGCIKRKTQAGVITHALPYSSGPVGGGVGGGAGGGEALGPGEPHVVVLPGKWCQEPAEAHQQGGPEGGLRGEGQ